MDQIHLSPLVDQIQLALGHISNIHKLPTNDETATSYATTKHNDDDEVAASDSKAKPKTWAPCNKHVGRAGGAHTV
jgi:hypothetical protein